MVGNNNNCNYNYILYHQLNGRLDQCTNEEIPIVQFAQLLQKLLISEPRSSFCFYIDHCSLNRWNNSNKISKNIINIKCTKLKHDVIQEPKSKKNTINNDSMTQDQHYAKIWTKTYLSSIASNGVIHSINAGTNGRFIMCNIRNMSNCSARHEDYFNDSTVYINIKQKEFTVRCNRVPCNKKPWK